MIVHQLSVLCPTPTLLQMGSLMMHYAYYLCVFAQLAESSIRDARRLEGHDVLSQVDLLIGSKSGGNVFVGATLPYGMAKGSRHEVRKYKKTI